MTKQSSTSKHAIGPLIGRSDEFSRIAACLKARRNVLLEGPVGVGKTKLAIGVVESLKRPIFRIDGDNRYSEQKLTGWFDPPAVMKFGFSKKSFIPGPLVQAMQEGGVLFINELNRLPEGVQNVLLPAIDERMIHVPRFGEVKAHEKFLVIATQNPKEFVATSHLSEAILDRFELVLLDYQSEGEELEIVSAQFSVAASKTLGGDLIKLIQLSVAIARMTRNHTRVRRGASIRAAMAVAEIGAVLLTSGQNLNDAFLKAVLMALPTRIEIEREADSEAHGHQEVELLLKDWVNEVLSGSEKKKN